MIKEALKMALEALEKNTKHLPVHFDCHFEAITVIKEALAQPEQEPVAWSSYEYDGVHHKPVAWMDANGNVSDNNDHKCFPIPLYTVIHPTPTQRKPLTDEEIGMTFRNAFPVGQVVFSNAAIEFARTIEAAHNIKETTE